MSTGDELCDACSKVDLYSLFTGPRYFPNSPDPVSRDDITTHVATLRGVVSNKACPLCRLVKHDLYAPDDVDPAYYHGQCDPDKIRCCLLAFRADYSEDPTYRNQDTRELMATRLEVRLVGRDTCSERDLSSTNIFSRGAGIRLLSPEFVVPIRPLLNGYRATSSERSLELLKQWIGTCENGHVDTCQFDSLNDLPLSLGLETIQVIDLRDRSVRAFDPRTIKYALLSYVWDEAGHEHRELFSTLQNKEGVGGEDLKTLPSHVPGIIEEAMMVCKRVLIPYLWVDLFCVHQADPDKKKSEIQAMGYIYRLSHITIVVGTSHGNGVHLAPTISKQEKQPLGSRQRIETIGTRQYITSLPSITDQIHVSAWSKRGWTYQEGQMARRIAFLGDFDLSFLCGAGHWRESLHSGTFGHDARRPGIDLHSQGYYALSSYTWLRQSEWSFDDYASIVLAYSQRKLTHESDRLDAISGCLNIISRSQGVHFLWGLPTIDFHYALLWSLGEYDRRREGFPSWSWSAWFALNQAHYVYPYDESSGSLNQSSNEQYTYQDQETKIIELHGALVGSGVEQAHQKNKCTQSLAQLSVSEASGILTIESEVVRFFFDIKADSSPPNYELAKKTGWGLVPCDFDSTEDQHAADWDQDKEYRLPRGRICLRNISGDVYPIHFPPGEHWPTFNLALPYTLRGSTLMWLLYQGIELVKIMEIQLQEGADGIEPLHHVLCLGIDRSNGHPDYVQRMGMAFVPKEAWEKAGPEKMTVKFR
ncbi:heterokaryon incompatibility protein-domain-containing protein [Apiospora rasikravindrae]|uniref:Heterokaryon incompatibility protein-domain-containing protein n=1 Tax=Apiospora rasikravindrae TaxID=990691 RepID=A0ABR1SK57_9PEZI